MTSRILSLIVVVLASMGFSLAESWHSTRDARRHEAAELALLDDEHRTSFSQLCAAIREWQVVVAREDSTLVRTLPYMRAKCGHCLRPHQEGGE